MEHRCRTCGRRLDLCVNQLLQLRLLVGTQRGVLGDSLPPQSRQFFETLALLGAEKAIRAHGPDDYQSLDLFLRQL